MQPYFWKKRGRGFAMTLFLSSVHMDDPYESWENGCEAHRLAMSNGRQVNSIHIKNITYKKYAIDKNFFHVKSEIFKLLGKETSELKQFVI